jgi:hypothetical protein
MLVMRRQSSLQLPANKLAKGERDGKREEQAKREAMGGVRDDFFC